MAHTRIKAHCRFNFGEVAFHFDKSIGQTARKDGNKDLGVIAPTRIMPHT